MASLPLLMVDRDWTIRTDAGASRIWGAALTLILLDRGAEHRGEAIVTSPVEL